MYCSFGCACSNTGWELWARPLNLMCTGPTQHKKNRPEDLFLSLLDLRHITAAMMFDIFFVFPVV
jgi:hypothetical protein